MLPHDFPRWDAVSQQTRRWLDAGVFAAIVHDLRTLLRLDVGRVGQPSAAILDRRTLQSTPESGGRAGDDGHQRRKGSKLHAAVDPLGHLLVLHVTPADAQDRAQVAALAEAVQEATGEAVQLASVDQGYTGAEPAAAAERYGIRREVGKLPEAKRGVVLLPKRGVFAGIATQARRRLGLSARELHVGTTSFSVCGEYAQDEGDDSDARWVLAETAHYPSGVARGLAV